MAFTLKEIATNEARLKCMLEKEIQHLEVNFDRIMERHGKELSNDREFLEATIHAHKMAIVAKKAHLKLALLAHRRLEGRKQ